MKKVRRSVFETNSSSTHSVSIRKGDVRDSYLTVNPDDNKVHVELGEYGWGYESLRSQSERLSYLCTMLMMTEARSIKAIEDIFETDGFKQINNLIAEKCNCDGIYLDDEIQIKDWGIDINGYIDHQSCEDYSNIQDFLNEYNTDIENFIFNDGVTVIIDNDNH
jgi:hypothetical protein